MQRSRFYTLWGGLSGQADTYCMVNVFLQRHSKRGYESIWIYPVCCDYVWTGMHAAFYSGICIQIAGWCDEICFRQVSPTDEVQVVVFGVFWKAAWCHHVWTSFIDGWERFRGEQPFWRMCFLDVECENDVFGNRLEFVLPRMTYLLDNNNFQTALYFKPFCMMMFLERSVYFWTGVVLQNTGKMHLQHMQMHVEVEEFIFVLLQLEFGIWYSGSEVHAACAQWFKHVARQNKRDKDNTAQRLADSLRHFPVFPCVARKRWERGQVRICGFLTCVCLQVYSSASPLRLEPNA